MRILIAERLRPYSHTPGTHCIVPGSSMSAQIFPCLVKFRDHRQAMSNLVAEIHFDLTGPWKKFTVLQDLERGWIQVWGETPHGFVRYRLISHSPGSGVSLYLEKAPNDRLELTQGNTKHILKSKESLPLVFKDQENHLYTPPTTDRLSLGNHKAQDWDLVRRRLDLKEILPAWFRLGQLIPPLEIPPAYEGNLELLRQCQEVINGGKPEQIAQSFNNLFQAGFEGILTPPTL